VRYVLFLSFNVFLIVEFWQGPPACNHLQLIAFLIFMKRKNSAYSPQHPEFKVVKQPYGENYDQPTSKESLEKLD
jgi:hypothetical protein